MPTVVGKFGKPLSRRRQSIGAFSRRPNSCMVLGRKAAMSWSVVPELLTVLDNKCADPGREQQRDPMAMEWCFRAQLVLRPLLLPAAVLSSELETMQRTQEAAPAVIPLLLPRDLLFSFALSCAATSSNMWLHETCMLRPAPVSIVVVVVNRDDASNAARHPANCRLS